MLDYAFSQLIDGMSLPGILLITFVLLFLYWIISGKRALFLFNCFLLVMMSLPVTGKLLLSPLDVGVLFEEVKDDQLFGKVDAIAVIAGGAHKDPQSDALMPSMTSFSRLKRAELLLNDLDVPLILSGSDDSAEGELLYLSERFEADNELHLSFDASGTAEHAANIARIMSSQGLKKVAVFVSGIHAYRTKAALEKYDVEVPIVIIGVQDSDIGLTDFIPGFEGFFYWKHALKEYAGLMLYSWKGII